MLSNNTISARFKSLALFTFVITGVLQADDRHTFTIYNQLTGTAASNYRLVKGTTVYDYPNTGSCDSWGPNTLSPTLASGGSTTFTVHGSAKCNIIGTIGSGYFNYTLQAINPFTKEYADVGLIQGDIHFQKNWGSWVLDVMDVGACSAPVQCTVTRTDEANANFYITNQASAAPGNAEPPFNSGTVPYNDITVFLTNSTNYVGWQSSLSTQGPWCTNTTHAPGAVYPGVRPYYTICINRGTVEHISNSELNVVYKLADQNGNLVSTCTIHVFDYRPTNNRTCEMCSCDGAVTAKVVPLTPSVGFTIEWVPASGLSSVPATAESALDRLLFDLVAYSGDSAMDRLRTYLNSAKAAVQHNEPVVANDLMKTFRYTVERGSGKTIPPDFATQLIAESASIHF